MRVFRLGQNQANTSLQMRQRCLEGEATTIGEISRGVGGGGEESSPVVAALHATLEGVRRSLNRFLDKNRTASLSLKVEMSRVNA